MTSGLAKRTKSHHLGAGDGTPKYRVIAPLIYAWSQDGQVLRGCYAGDVVDYLNPKQEAHFLRKGLVEPITELPAVSSSEQLPLRLPPVVGGVETNSEVVDECVADLAAIGVKPDSGSPTCRQALRESGLAYSNDVIAAAVRLRKERLSAVPDSGADSS